MKRNAVVRPIDPQAAARARQRLFGLLESNPQGLLEGMIRNAAMVSALADDLARQLFAALAAKNLRQGLLLLLEQPRLSLEKAELLTEVLCLGEAAVQEHGL